MWASDLEGVQSGAPDTELHSPKGLSFIIDMISNNTAKVDCFPAELQPYTNFVSEASDTMVNKLTCEVKLENINILIALCLYFTFKGWEKFKL